MGKLLFWCGEDKIVTAARRPCGSPSGLLMPSGLRAAPGPGRGYGYPQRSPAAGARSWVRTFCAHGMDVEETRACPARSDARRGRVAESPHERPARMFEVACNPDLASRLVLVRLPVAGGTRGQGLGAVAADQLSTATRPTASTGEAGASSVGPLRPRRGGCGAGPGLVPERRSQLVFTGSGAAGDLEKPPRTARAARPGVVPGRRAGGLEELTILVDTRERHPWTLRRAAGGVDRAAGPPAGDYAVETPGGRAGRGGGAQDPGRPGWSLADGSSTTCWLS